jgi:predicted transcriptional regulator
MKKAILMENLENLPEEFSVDDLIERLLILQKIEEGRKQANDGKILSEDEVKVKLGKWLK